MGEYLSVLKIVELFANALLTGQVTNTLANFVHLAIEISKTRFILYP
jgi:hypothetical protein